MMYKRILVPTDGSGSSRLALTHAIKLARISGAEIFLLHVTLPPQAYLGNNLAYGATFSDEELQELGSSIIEETTKDQALDNIKITLKIISGSPAQKINALVREEKIDLVIMGSHGHGPFAGAFLGSVSQRVLAKVNCPVMVVKDPNSYEVIEE